MKKNIYILIGGGCHTGSPKNKLIKEIGYWIFFKKIKKSNALIIPFAKDEIDWEKSLIKYKKTIFKPFINKGLMHLSLANKKDFKKQVISADILFFTGGSELNLKKFFKNNQIPSNKIIIGVSAGANFLSKSYFSNDRQQVERGLGVLPIKTICHFSENNLERVNRLYESKSITILPIKNNEFVTLIF